MHSFCHHAMAHCCVHCTAQAHERYVCTFHILATSIPLQNVVTAGTPLRCRRGSAISGTTTATLLTSCLGLQEARAMQEARADRTEAKPTHRTHPCTNPRCTVRGSDKSADLRTLVCSTCKQECIHARPERPYKGQIYECPLPSGALPRKQRLPQGWLCQKCNREG